MRSLLKGKRRIVILDDIARADQFILEADWLDIATSSFSLNRCIITSRDLPTAWEDNRVVRCVRMDSRMNAPIAEAILASYAYDDHDAEQLQHQHKVLQCHH